MIPQRVRRLTLLMLLALGIGGCSLLNPHFERPRLSLAGVEMQGTQLLKQRFRVRIRVENPNDRALPIRALDFTMQLGGEDLGVGAIEAPFTVPARGEAEFATIVTTDLATTLLKILPRIKDSSQPIEYRLSGTVTTDLAFVKSIPFDQRGSFTLN